MFENRLKWFAAVLAVSAAVIVLRLVEIQVVRAADYEALADRILTRPVRYLPAIRGSILDRHGEVLAEDVPSFDVAVHYAVLSGDSQRYLLAVARELRAAGQFPPSTSLSDAVALLHQRIPRMWQRLAELSGTSVVELIERGERVARRIRELRRVVAERRGVEQPVAEEFAFHPLIERVDDDVALAVRAELRDMPWVQVRPTTRRVAHDEGGLAHVIGRVGPVSADALEHDPLADDELRGLRADERCGLNGVERAAELLLRGVRGRVIEDFGEAPIERIDAQRGRDVRLTIDAALQRRVHALLGEHVERSLHPAGGAAVVLDARSRDVLAMASYPSYRIERLGAEYAELAGDTRRLPLLSRCVAGQYPPGSICKLAALFGALADGTVQEWTEIVCNGFLRAERPDAFRCWIFNQYGAVHGAQSAEDAIRNSCNIYFYAVGERLGPQRLCEWLGRFGLGRSAGSGLPEEVDGILPTADWLARHRGRSPQVADAWNYAIGQGELTATPLQAANAAATLATGVWSPVNLIVPDAQPTRPDPDELPSGPLHVLRRGAWRVVNEPGGTGEAARLEIGDHVLCGKTGSAQADPRPVAWRFTVERPDGSRQEVVARTREEALANLHAPDARVVGWRAAEKYPAPAAGERAISHAWFIGFTQSADTRPGDEPRGRVYAIAVLIEYGGSGGREAGPLAREVAEAALVRGRP